MNTSFKYPDLKIYFASRKFLNRLFLFCNACLTGFWLGIFNRENLYTVDQIYYDKDQMYRDDKYNKSGLWKWEQKVIEKYFADCKNLLLIGAGGGREVLALSRLNYQVDGYECNKNLVEFANQLLTQENVNSQVKLIARDSCPETQQKYDGVIIGWGAYMLIQGRDRRINLLKKIKETMNPQAPIFLSFYCYQKTNRYYYIIAKIGNSIRWLLRRDLLDVGDDLVPNYVHYFTQTQIEKELKEASLKLVMYSTEEYGHAVGISQ
jgi:hypothetical protein